MIFIILALSSQISQAQMTLCDQTYTTGNYYFYEIAIPTTGNGLPTMAPLYAITYTSQDTWEDSCFGGPCTHTVYNEYAEDTITTCITYTLTDSLGYVDTLICCFNNVWNGDEWIESENEVNPTDALLNICDSLDVYTSNSSENSVTLSTNLYFLESNLEISFSWESWGDYLDVEIVEGQNAFFNLPNNLESFYFLLQVVIDNEQIENSEVLCIYPFLIQWDSSTNTWQANSLTMSQMPTSLDAYSQPSERKLIKIVDALGRENQENKSMVLFYIYDDGKIEKKFIIE